MPTGGIACPEPLFRHVRRTLGSRRQWTRRWTSWSGRREDGVVPWGLLADLTAVAHLGFVVFVPTGGWLALRRPRLLAVHVPAAAYALGIVTVGWTCPLTTLENDVRARAGRDALELGFIDTYLTGVVYPARWLVLAQGLVALAVVASYALLVRRHRRQRRHRRRRRRGSQQLVAG